VLVEQRDLLGEGQARQQVASPHSQRLRRIAKDGPGWLNSVVGHGTPRVVRSDGQ